MNSVNNQGHVGPAARTYGAQATAPAALGAHRVAQGALPSGPPATGGFGQKAKAFFQGLGDKFASLRRTATPRPVTISAKTDAWRAARPEQKVKDWNDAPVDLEANSSTKRGQASSRGKALTNLGTAKAAFGSNGVHQMAGRMLGLFKDEAQANAGQPGKPQTWQDCAKASFRDELVRMKSYKEAGSTIDGLSDHFVTYTKAGVEPELDEMGQILTGLRASVTQPAGFERDARAAFSKEIDTEMGKLGTFFRGNTATFLRNANAKQAKQVIEAFTDVLSSLKNKDRVDLANKIEGQPTTVQQDAVNDLTRQVLDRAFDLSGDGGDDYAQKLDPSVRKFLSDTSSEIAGKTNFSASDRNDGIRKWFSGGLGLRDFGSTASETIKDSLHRKAGVMVATNVVRIFGDVAASATQSKLGADAAKSYGTFHKEIGPQFASLLTKLGMPKVV